MRAAAVLLLLGAALLLLPPTAPSPASSPRPLPRVTLISDSVAGAISLDLGAKLILAQGIDLFLEPGEARRLGGDTPVGGIAPPTVLQLIATLGRRLGPTVIIDVGYNDISSQYAQNMEAALAALRGSGVKRVLWTTLRLSPKHLGNATMNAAITAAAARHPEVTVVDWNAYAQDHPEWVQADDVHLLGDGPRALARLFHATLVGLGIPRTR